MKRAGNLLPEIAATENLRLAFWKAARAKAVRPEVVAYRADLEENLAALREGLLHGTARVGDYHFFTIHDPKERRICAASFGERVLHHALMNVCEPHIERRLVPDTYACRKGRGRIEALARAQHNARNHQWYLKMDARKYFDSIAHDVLLGLLGRVFKDAAVLEFFRRIVASYNTTPGRGVPIGNLTSQHFANLYLGELDRFVKETLRVRGYVRYMDDFVLWGATAEEVRVARRVVEEFLRERLKLETKPAQINRTSRGIPFLGCRLFPDRLRLDRRGRVRFVSRLKRLESDFAAARIGGLELQQRATALCAHTEICGARGFRRAVLDFQDGETMWVAAMDAPSGSNRVLRGGNWNNNANNCRVANRNNNSPGNSNNNNGFRCVRSSETGPAVGRNSDPAAIPSRAHHARAKTPPGPPGVSSPVDAGSNAPGGSFLGAQGHNPVGVGRHVGV